MKAVFLLLALAVTTAGSGCAQSCAAGLLTGVLADQAGELVVIPHDGGPQEMVKWPGGHGVGKQDDTLVVTNFFGRVVAREGDTVRLGGGETSRKGTWDVCGLFEVGT